MINNRTVNLLYRNFNDIDPLFKPVQKEVIRKLHEGQELSENEKRYLRGRMGSRIKALEVLFRSKNYPKGGIPLSNLQDYYITGFEALKHNGYGWYYDTKTIIVINTRIKGTVEYGNKKVKYIRVKSLKNREYQIDDLTGQRYATNEQILKDSRSMNNLSLERAWWSMFNRYPDIFVKDKDAYTQDHEQKKESLS